MTLNEYETLTGTTVPASQQTFVTAQIAEAQSALEDLLGFTLDPDKTLTNYYEELGKTQSECACPDVNTENLQDPDAVEGAYRLYRWNEKDRFIHIDPFSDIHKVKLVRVHPELAEDDKNGITVRTLEADEYRVQVGKDGVSKFLEICWDCFCVCPCGSECLQLAVDADWLWADDLPTDLQRVWARLVGFASDSTANVRSESIGPHSYTKFERLDPYTDSRYTRVIRRYAGPYGSIVKNPVL